MSDHYRRLVRNLREKKHETITLKGPPVSIPKGESGKTDQLQPERDSDKGRK